MCRGDRAVVGIPRDAKDDVWVALDSIQHLLGPPRGSAPSTAVAATLQPRSGGTEGARPRLRGADAP
jgi:hypothetical protein